MSAPSTEYSFTLPVGLTDADGVCHREGSMRLATARDEIEPLRDARVRENGAYLSVLKLARVLTHLGAIRPVTPTLVEQLYAADFAHLQRLYGQINSTPGAGSTHGPPAAPAELPPSDPPTPARGPALAGVSETALDWMLDGAPTAAPDAHEALPIGVLQDRERALSREALMRGSSPPRRGSVHEGLSPHGESSPAGEVSGEPLMRLSSHPLTAPSTSSASSSEPMAPLGAGTGPVDMEDVYEEIIVRLRRDLLVERERMGAPFGA